MAGGEGATVGDRLRRARRRRFVGRSGEIELFCGALGAAGGESFSVLFLYGPGGVGKSALLGELAEAARREGAEPVLVDARTIDPNPVAAGQALETLARPDAARRVILIDTYEQLAPLDDWIRERFLPGLPDDSLVVIAGRDAPSARWLADPGWRDLLRVVSLRNLRPDDTRAYLRIEGVPAELHERVLGMSHGHPLTLSLIVDLIGRHRRAGAAVPGMLTEAPDVVRALLGRVIDQVPSPRHGEALQICAHARFTTEEMLRATMGGGDVPRLFGWLRTLSFVEEGTYGLYPHDVARDILDADLRWRDSPGYAALHRRLRTHFVERLRQAQGSDRDKSSYMADIMFLSRSHPIVRSYWLVPSLGQMYVDELRPGDAGAVLDMTRRMQGADQAALAAYWMRRQPEAFGIFRDADGETFGYAAYLALHEADEHDLATDPGVRAMWEYALRHGPPRPGESVLAMRLFVNTELAARPSRAATMLRLWHLQKIISQDGGRAWNFTTVVPHSNDVGPMMEHHDFHHAAEAGYEVDGLPYEVYAHDWRRLGVDDWLELIADRELGAPVTPPTGPAPELVLSQPGFADAVRAALRDLHRPERLAGNPLLRSQLVRHRAGDGRDAAEALGELIREAAGALRADPREESLFRVIDRTFLRPAPTQERAAELLALSFSTYRRHRNRGIERITAWLWQRELYGPDPKGTGHQVDT